MNCYQSPTLNVEKSINNRIFPHVIACLRKKKKKKKSSHIAVSLLFFIPTFYEILCTRPNKKKRKSKDRPSESN